MSDTATLVIKDHRSLALAFLKMHYETELVCPYCGDQKTHSSPGCCGESSAHFEKVYVDDDCVPIDLDEYFKYFDIDRERALYEKVTGWKAKL